MKVDKRAEVVGASKALFSLPSHGKLLLYLFAVCFAAGAVMRWLIGNDPGSAMVFGGSEGVWLLFVPSLLAAGFVATAIDPKRLKAGFRQLLFVSLLGASAYSLLSVIGLVLTGSRAASLLAMFNTDLAAFLLVGNALAVLVWFIALFVVLNVPAWKALLLSFVQPFFNVAFLFFWSKTGFFDSALFMGSPVIAGFRIIGASAVLLTGLWAVFYLLNAPAKKNYGVSMIKAATFFLGQWLRGKKELEELMAELGEQVTTFVGFVAFRSVKSKKQKALFVSPLIHFGPFGNLGGSEFPAILSAGIEKRFGGKAFVFHGTVNHDFNPVYSSSVQIVEHELVKGVEGASEYSDKAGLLQARSNLASLNGFSFGDNAFLLASRAPESTEDFDAAVGTALRYKIQAKGYREAVLCDAHNSIKSGEMFDIGSRDYFDYEAAVDALKEEQQGKLRVGVASDPLKEFSKRQGLGGAGLHVAVIDAGGKRGCIILFDANNMVPEFRERILGDLKGYCFDYCEVATTDSHVVNTINGTHNPLGLHADRNAIAKKVYSCVEKALVDLEECEAAVETLKVPITIYGAKRQSEILTLINSVIAIARIIAPLALVVSIILAFLLLAVA